MSILSIAEDWMNKYIDRGAQVCIAPDINALKLITSRFWGYFSVVFLDMNDFDHTKQTCHIDRDVT